MLKKYKDKLDLVIILTPSGSHFKHSLLALKKGFGIETDIRDLDGKYVISHDPPIKTKEIIEFKKFLKIFKEKNKNLILAINIKSDGIAKNIYDLCLSEEISNFFIFDMSIPDLIYENQLGCKNLFLRLVISMPPHVSINKINDSKK